MSAVAQQARHEDAEVGDDAPGRCPGDLPRTLDTSTADLAAEPGELLGLPTAEQAALLRLRHGGPRAWMPEAGR